MRIYVCTLQMMIGSDLRCTTTHIYRVVLVVPRRPYLGDFFMALCCSKALSRYHQEALVFLCELWLNSTLPLPPPSIERFVHPVVWELCESWGGREGRGGCFRLFFPFFPRFFRVSLSLFYGNMEMYVHYIHAGKKMLQASKRKRRGGSIESQTHHPSLTPLLL